MGWCRQHCVSEQRGALLACLRSPLAIAAATCGVVTTTRKLNIMPQKVNMMVARPTPASCAAPRRPTSAACTHAGAPVSGIAGMAEGESGYLASSALSTHLSVFMTSVYHAEIGCYHCVPAPLRDVKVCRATANTVVRRGLRAPGR